MHNILVIIKKQLRDTLKNRTILLQFILFPAMTLIMENAVTLEDMPEQFFTRLFAVMYVGMAPITSTAAVIAEEKEKNTLRVLMMANIKPWQYLAGVGIYIFAICMLGAGVMSLSFPASDRGFFLLVMAMGFVISILAGACIGIFSKNQMMATSTVIPFMMIFSFAPMLSMYNDTVKKCSTVVFTQQLKTLFDEMSFAGTGGPWLWVLCANAAVCALLFVLAYRKKGLE